MGGYVYSGQYGNSNNTWTTTGPLRPQAAGQDIKVWTYSDNRGPGFELSDKGNLEFLDGDGARCQQAFVFASCRTFSLASARLNRSVAIISARRVLFRWRNAWINRKKLSTNLITFRPSLISAK